MSMVRFGDVTRGFERAPSVADRDRIALLSDDRAYRTELADHLRREGFEVVHGAATTATLRRVPGWTDSWHGIEHMAAVLLDVTLQQDGAGADAAIALVDAVRRRDWSLPVVLLTRAFGASLPSGGRAYGANIVFEGRPPASEVTAAVLRLRPQRQAALGAAHNTPPAHGVPESARGKPHS